MAGSTARCFNCGGTDAIVRLHGFPVCSACVPKLGLMTDDTIDRHAAGNPGMLAEVRDRLQSFERDYIRKRIKLLHIKDRLERRR